MKIKNEYESHVISCLENNMICKYWLAQLDSINTIDEDKMWILSQTEYDDKCIRTILINDRHIIFYGGSLQALKGDKKSKDSDCYENAPAINCEYTSEAFMYSPIHELRGNNGKVLVNIPRIVGLMTEMIEEKMKQMHPGFQFGKINQVTIGGKTYYYFEYKVLPLNWKSWF